MQGSGFAMVVRLILKPTQARIAGLFDRSFILKWTRS
jgi:hypothetical protein